MYGQNNLLVNPSRHAKLAGWVLNATLLASSNAGVFAFGEFFDHVFVEFGQVARVAAGHHIAADTR
jgi:hypothetical protein